MNAIVLDLTSDQHYISLQFNQHRYEFSFNEKSLTKRNDWEKKIATMKDSVPEFDFKKIDKMAYAAGPGSYTGARLAYTFMQTLELILDKEFYAFSNLKALNFSNPQKLAVIKGNKNDFFYRSMGKDYYCDSLAGLPKGNFIGFKSDQLLLEPMEEVDRSVVCKNILDMVLEADNLHLKTNYPNYIKELSYQKNK